MNKRANNCSDGSTDKPFRETRRTHLGLPIGLAVNLSPLSVVLVLAREPQPVQPLEHVEDGLGRLGEHRHHGYAGQQSYAVVNLREGHGEERVEEGVERRDLAIRLLDDGLGRLDSGAQGEVLLAESPGEFRVGIFFFPRPVDVSELI